PVPGKRLVAPMLIACLAVKCVTTVIALGSGAARPSGRSAVTSTATVASASQLASASRVQWGLWEPAWQLSNGGVDLSVFTHAESNLYHHADIVHWFAGWSESWAWYDSGLLQQVVKSGRTPMITWKPTGISLQAIPSGAQDAYI